MSPDARRRLEESDDEPTQRDRRPGDVAPALSPGTTLANLRVRRLIGAGTSSELFEAENLVAGKPCTIKLFRRELGIGAVARGRYTHLAQRAARLEHRAIAEVFNFGEGPDGRFYAVGELVPGTGLDRLLHKHGRLARRSYVPLLRQLCGALAAAHTQKIPHLRLRANNVMTRWADQETPDVKLLDFGVSRLHGPANEPIQELRLGPDDALCIAPEQAKGEVGDARSDIYAVCVLLYQIVCGKLPFRGDSYPATLDLHLSAQPLPPGQLAPVSSDLEQTILRGLEKDPRRRIPSIEALLSALDPVSVSTGTHRIRARNQQARMRTLSTGEYQASEASGQQAATTADHAAVSPPITHRFSRLKLAAVVVVGVAIAAALASWLL